MPNHPKPTDLKSNMILAQIYNDECDPETILKTAEDFDRICVHQPACTHNNESNPSRRLRVGYMSSNFSNHAVGQFIQPVLEAHNHDMFEIFGYSNTHQPDNVTKDIESLCDHWYPINTMKDEELAKQINQDSIDILIDLTCHSPNNRLAALAYKPAPIQISWLGFNATSGLSEIDYALTDAVACPDGEEHYLTETPLLLPKGVFCYQPFKHNDEPTITAPSRENKNIVFGSFNKLAKTNSTTLQLWSKVLKMVPDSRILFKSKLLNSSSTRQLFLDRCNRHGIPAERVEILPFDINPDSYMNDYLKIDILLDTTPCNAGIATCDALWMGVPMVTLSSPGITARLSSSILTQLGLKKWIAQTPEQYVKIAKSLASSRKKLDKQRTDLRARITSSPLYDTRGYAKQLEEAYRQVWEKWCLQQ